MFAPVARLASIRTLLAIAAAQNLEIHQIDIKGAYLNRELTEEERIYMKQPPGYPVSPNSSDVLQLLNGLKQVGRRWYQRLVNFHNIFCIRFPQAMIHPNYFCATRLYLLVLWQFVLLFIILVANN